MKRKKKLSASDRGYLKVTEGLLNKTMSDEDALSLLVESGMSPDYESAKITLSFIKNDITQYRIDKACGLLKQ
jgi:hypothetical protein